MIAPKHCALAVAGGFVLSAFIGLVSGNFGPLMFVRALVCGIVVGVVWFGIYGVFTVVLGLEDSTGVTAPGSSVDISVDSEDFLGDGAEATFNLGNLEESDPGENNGSVEEARAAIITAPSSTTEDGADDAQRGFRPGGGSDAGQEKSEPAVTLAGRTVGKFAAVDPVAEDAAEADKPVFTARPLATGRKLDSSGLGDLENLDLALAAKTIQSLLRSE